MNTDVTMINYIEMPKKAPGKSEALNLPDSVRRGRPWRIEEISLADWPKRRSAAFSIATGFH